MVSQKIRQREFFQRLTEFFLCIYGDVSGPGGTGANLLPPPREQERVSK